jgi:CRISPR-associated protein Cas1
MKTRNVKVALEGFGELLGREKGCLVVKNRKGESRRYPLLERSISEIQIRTGNLVSSGAIASISFWNIPCIFLTQYGNPIAILKPLSDDDHVKTRICQYEALTNGKGIEIAKQIVLAKIKGQNELLKYYGLKWHDSFRYSQAVKSLNDNDVGRLRNRLMSMEGHFSEQYFRNIHGLFNQAFLPERLRRRTFLAYDGLDNIFNLGYRCLSFRIYIALIRAKLEPFLGYLHSVMRDLPSLVCDFEDLYRYLIDDFLVGFCQTVKPSDFILQKEKYEGRKIGSREYLNEKKNRELVKSLDKYFESKVEIPRIKRGKKQKLDTLIREEALLLAQYLRAERQSWNPRIVSLA